MALKHAVLAALSDGEATGYELSKRFDVAVANFWSASPQQIYRELDRLESAGLLEARLVEQTGRPNKRIFKLTADGEVELLRFIETDSRPAVIRDDLLVKVAALDDSNAGAVEDAVRGRLDQSIAKLDLYRNLRAMALNGREEAEMLASGGRIGGYLALLRGISFEEDDQRWCELVLKVLAGRRSGVPG